jgi:hypothetical protein
MSHWAFERGVRDARAGRPIDPAYDRWEDVNEQWNYERGRQWAVLVPASVELKCNGAVTQEALRWFKRVGSNIR